jgi:hypothetical protein
LLGILFALAVTHAQSSTAPLEFRTLPDGTFIATNVAMAFVIRLAIASPVSVAML